MIKISVITVVLNNKAYMSDCINSVINQTYKNYEYIIVDGKSTDGTLDIIKGCGDKISKYISEIDHGIYDAMNKGINMASGDIIGFLNADDVYYDSNVLENVVLVMSDQKVDACYSDLLYVKKENLDKVIRYWRSSTFSSGLFKKGWVPAHPTFFVRKKIYEQYGFFDLDYKLAADFELMVRFLEREKINVRYIPKVFVKMRIGGSTNKSIINIVKQNIEIFRACKKNNVEISPILFLINKSISRLKQFVYI